MYPECVALHHSDEDGWCTFLLLYIPASVVPEVLLVFALCVCMRACVCVLKPEKFMLELIILREIVNMIQ